LQEREGANTACLRQEQVDWLDGKRDGFKLKTGLLLGAVFETWEGQLKDNFGDLFK
jgi:hypothetical protein